MNEFQSNTETQVQEELLQDLFNFHGDGDTVEKRAVIREKFIANQTGKELREYWLNLFQLLTYCIQAVKDNEALFTTVVKALAIVTASLKEIQSAHATTDENADVVVSTSLKFILSWQEANFLAIFFRDLYGYGLKNDFNSEEMSDIFEYYCLFDDLSRAKIY